MRGSAKPVTPDIDRDEFEGIAARINTIAKGITLYASANDKAILVARLWRSGHPRAGDVLENGPVVVAGVDSIDITEVSTDFLSLNHGTYVEGKALINDIGLLLRNGTHPPDQRTPIYESHGQGRSKYWVYPR